MIRFPLSCDVKAWNYLDTVGKKKYFVNYFNLKQYPLTSSLQGQDYENEEKICNKH